MNLCDDRAAYWFYKEFSEGAAYRRLRPTEEDFLVESIDKRAHTSICELSGLDFPPNELFIPVTDGIPDIECAVRLSQSKAECMGDVYGFRIPMPLCGNGGVLKILNVMGTVNLVYARQHSTWRY